MRFNADNRNVDNFVTNLKIRF